MKRLEYSRGKETTHSRRCPDVIIPEFSLWEQQEEPKARSAASFTVSQMKSSGTILLLHVAKLWTEEPSVECSWERRP